MILGCPNCGTKFTVPDGAITDAGRKVRCATCQHVWHATPADAVAPPPPQAAPQPPLPPVVQAMGMPPGHAGGYPPEAHEPSPPPDAEMNARMAAIRRDMLAGDEGVDAPAAQHDDFGSDDDDLAVADDFGGLPDDGYDADDEGMPGDDGPPDDMADVLGTIRAAAGEAGLDVDEYDEDEEDDAIARLEARASRDAARGAEKRRRLLTLAFWALLVVIWVGVPVALLGFPEKVKSMWPASQVLYDLIQSSSDVERFREGAETLSRPITEEPTRVEALLDPPRTQERNGQIALVLTGFVENQGRRSARVPRLRMTVLDNRGQVIDAWEFDPPGRLITRGQQLRFEQVRSPVPAGANQVTVSVVEGQYSLTEAEQRG